MEFGDYRVEIIPDTEFRLDGGAMFGVVPRVLWERVCPPDAKNRIRLNMNCVFIDTGKERILIETGIGEKWSAKETEIYGIFREKPLAETLFEKTGCRPDAITVVINTHLHFDHAGGNTILSVPGAVATGLLQPQRHRDTEEADQERSGSPHYKAGVDAAPADGVVLSSAARPEAHASGTLALQSQFPNARYLVSKNEFTHAQNPHERDRASYLPGNWLPLQESGQLELMPDEYEPIPGLNIQAVRGHSKTMQTWRLDRDRQTIYGFADLIPTRHHIPLPWIMGYDLYPLETLEFKKRILPQAVQEDWFCLFYHDHEMPLCRLAELDGKLTAIGYVQN